MALLIIRHGETAGNAAGIVQMPETPLNERGLEQAQRVARRVAQQGVCRIIASDYARAYMTAEAVRAATKAPMEINELLRERHFGELRGRLHSEIGDLYHPDLAPVGGESWQDFYERVARAWTMICAQAARTDGNLALVTHGLVCYALARNHLTLAAGEEASFGIGNTALTIVEPQPPWRVELLNCTTHLYDIGFSSMDRQGA